MSFGKLEHKPVEVFDNSAIKTWRQCPRRFYYRYVLGFTEKDTPPYFTFGSSYHKFREVFDLTWSEFHDVDFDTRIEASYLKAYAAGISLWDKKFTKSITLNTRWDFLTKDRLKKSFAVVKEWLIGEKKQNKLIVVATEQPIVVELGGHPYAGRADQIVDWNTRFWGRDFKTSSKEGKYYQRSLKPNSQFAGYTFLESAVKASKVQGQLVEVLYNTKTVGPKVVPYNVSFTQEEIDEWKRDTIYYMEQVRTAIASLSTLNGPDNFPMNDNACWNCPFHMVCTAASEYSKVSTLQNRYKIEHWDCLKSEDHE